MTQEEKQLLLRDLCARLPYGVKIRYVENLVVRKINHTITLNNIYLEHIINGDADIKPYLRPMSSMTDEELNEYRSLMTFYNCAGVSTYWDNYDSIDWLNAHHFDYRRLIEKGLALEALEGMYK